MLTAVSVAVNGRDGAPLEGAEVTLHRPSGSGKLGLSYGDGRVLFEVMRGVEGDLDADLSTLGPPVTSTSALETLRMAVGLNPSWGQATAKDFIAADFNADGRITAQDALEILRVAVGLTAEHAPRWVFVNSEADLSHITSSNTHFDPGLRLDPVMNDISDLSLTGILVGHVQEYV